MPFFYLYDDIIIIIRFAFVGLAVQISLGKTNLGWQPVVSAFSTSRHFRSIFMLINMTSSLSTPFIYQHNRHVVSINTSTLFFCRPLCRANPSSVFFFFLCVCRVQNCMAASVLLMGGACHSIKCSTGVIAVFFADAAACQSSLTVRKKFHHHL